MKYDRFMGGFVWEWCDHAVYGGTTPDNRDIFRYGGDFGEYPHDGNFCMDGLVYPDRTPHTGLLEYKNVIRPVRAALVNRETGEIQLTNYRDFTNTEEFLTLSWEIQQDGDTVACGVMDGGIPCNIAIFRFVLLEVFAYLFCSFIAVEHHGFNAVGKSDVIHIIYIANVIEFLGQLLGLLFRHMVYSKKLVVTKNNSIYLFHNYLLFSESLNISCTMRCVL